MELILAEIGTCKGASKYGCSTRNVEDQASAAPHGRLPPGSLVRVSIVQAEFRNYLCSGALGGPRLGRREI
jgi:hypothetical protein